MKRLLFSMLVLALVLLLSVACGESQDTTEVTTGMLPISSSVQQATTTQPQTTLPETTVAVTTKSDEERFMKNTYSKAALELVLTVCEQYYDLRSHTLATSLTDRKGTTVWPLASFIEMLAEAHRSFPSNETIKKYYVDALDNCLRKHMVTGATITPPSGKVYKNQIYYNAGPNWQGDFYYDDNAWICIQLLDAYKLLGKETYLTTAKKILEFMWTGWDDRAGGGIYWDKTFEGKGVCSNGPVAIAYCVGYQLTGEEEYLNRAKMIYDWCGRMVRGKDGIYNAGVKNLNVTEYKESNLDPWRPAYDQGTMISTAALLYEITGDERYKAELKTTATAAKSLMFDNDGMKRNPIFKSWCVGWLVRGEMLAYEVGSTASCTTFMRSLERTLLKTLKTKDENGHYDPFFCSPGTDFWSEDYFDNDVIMPTGVATVFLLYARYKVCQNPS